jgi:Protein of unknown function (DUF3309)
MSDDQQLTKFLAFNVAQAKEGVSMELLLIVLVILLWFGGIGTWPSFGYHPYGYGPSGLLLVLMVIILIVFLLRRRRI